jgi:hypothetical protein
MTDSSGRSNSGLRARTGSWRKRVLLLSFPLLCAVLYLGREALVHPPIESLLKRMAPRYGYDLTLEDIESDWFHRIALEGVALRSSSQDAVLESLQAGELIVRYSLPTLLRAGLPQGLSVELDSADLVLDLGKRRSGGGTRRGNPLERLPALGIRRSSIRLELGRGGRVSLEGIELTAREPGTGDLHLARAAWERVGRPPLEAEVDATLRLFPGAVAAERIELKHGGNLVGARDLRIRLANGSPERMGELFIDCTDLPAALRPFVSSEWFQELPDHRIRIQARGSPPSPHDSGRMHEQLELESAELATPLGTVHSRRGSLSLTAWPPPWRAEVQARMDELRPLGARWDLACEGRAEGMAVLESAEGGALRASFALNAQELAVGGHELGHALLGGTYGNGVLDLERFRLASPAFLVEGEGSYEFATGRVREVAVEAELFDLEGALAKAGESSDPRIVLECPLSLRANAQGPLKGLRGTVSLRGESLEIAGERFGDLRCDLMIDPEVWTVERLAFQSRIGPIQSRGAFVDPWIALREGDFDLRLDSLSIGDEPEKLRLARPVHATVGAAAWSAAGVLLQGPAGELELSLEGAPGQTSVQVAAAGFLPGAFVPEWPGDPGQGGVDFELDLVRSGSGLTASSRGSIAQLDLDELASSLDWNVSLDEGLLRVDRFEVESVRDGAIEVEGWIHGSAHLGEGPLDLRGAWRMSMPGGQAFRSLGEDAFLQGEIVGDLAVAGTWNAPEAELTQGGRGIRVRKGGRELGPGHLDLALRLDRGLSIERGELLLPGLGSVSLQGGWDIEGDPGKLLSDGAAGLRAAPLELLARADLEDISPLGGWTDALRRCEGALTASLQCSGTLAAPRWEGTVELAEAAALLAASVPPFQELQAFLRLGDGAIEVEKLEGEIGAAPFSARGRVEMGGDEPVFALDLEAESLLLARSEAVRIRADANLSVTGPLSALSIGGTMALRDSRVYQSVDLLSLLRAESGPTGPRGLGLFSLRDPVLSTLRFDLDIETAEPIDLRSNLARGLVRMDLHLGGTGEVPLPNGRLFLEDLVLRLPAGVVTFSSGLVAFEVKNPFVPTLELQGKARLAGYDISMQVEGPYDRPEIEISSTPPLPGEDLLALLLTGRPPTEDLRDTGKRASQSIAVYLAQDWLRQISGEDFNDESFLDRFQFVTGRDVSKGGSLTTEASVRVARGTFAEKDTLYLVGERDVYEEYNFGVRLLFRFR